MPKKESDDLEIDVVINKIADYLKQYKSNDNLSKIYQWPIDNAIKKLAVFDECASNCINPNDNTLNKTLVVRVCIQKKLQEDISDELKKKYIK
ncbi:MAG: hypothetical protein PHU14_10705 [Methylovulum sp.]|nr:hypothetical protein [Methylovulum sp.]